MATFYTKLPNGEAWVFESDLPPAVVKALLRNENTSWEEGNVFLKPVIDVQFLDRIPRYGSFSGVLYQYGRYLLSEAWISTLDL